MSQENVEIAKRSVEAFAAGGVERALSFLSRDVVWYPFPEWVEESEFHSHDGFRRMAAFFTDTFDDFAIRVEEFRDLGDRVVELGETTGRIKGSTGAPICQPLAIVLSDFRDGKIGQGRNFSTWRQALEAVRLRE
jgi:ketosteroid isomerase-like protein